MRRIGVIGGTFDPIHNGHLLLARFALEEIPLNEVLFIPAADPPLKPGAFALGAERLAMVEHAIAGCGARRRNGTESPRRRNIAFTSGNCPVPIGCSNACFRRSTKIPDSQTQRSSSIVTTARASASMACLGRTSGSPAIPFCSRSAAPVSNRATSRESTI